MTIIHTSGSSGKPKGVLLTHAQLVESALSHVKYMHLTEEDRFYMTSPMFHALGCIGSIGSTFNMMLPHYKKIFTLFDEGKRAEALELQHKANNCMEAMCRVGLIPAIKYELARQGYPVGEARAPFTPLTDEQKAYIDAVLDRDLVTE